MGLERASTGRPSARRSWVRFARVRTDPGTALLAQAEAVAETEMKTKIKTEAEANVLREMEAEEKAATPARH